MSNAKKDKIWQAPWGYSESFVIVLGIALVGLMLEVTVGSFNFFLLASPVNYFVGGALIVLSTLIGVKAHKSSLGRWFVGAPMSVALISVLLIFTIIMGIIPQMNYSQTLLGLDAITSNWAFVMIYTLTISVLGAIMVNRARGFRFRDLPFYLNHIGLWLLLSSSGLGYADMQRYIIYVSEGETQWRVYDNEGGIKELPIAIHLKDFKVEFYPSREIYFDAATGEIQRGNPDSYKGDDRYKMVMSEPEPKRFSSDVEVYTQQGHSIKTTIEVNNPLRIESWTIYQYGYDNLAGNLSTYSSFELVYDSWVDLVYIGIAMMMMGSIAMVVTGRGVKRRGV